MITKVDFRNCAFNLIVEEDKAKSEKVNNKMRGGLSKGPKKQEPLVYYILEGMEKEYGSNWDKDKNESEKREMLRQIKTKILDKMKEDAGITSME